MKLAIIRGRMQRERKNRLYKKLKFLESYGLRVINCDGSKAVEICDKNGYHYTNIIPTNRLFKKYDVIDMWNSCDIIEMNGNQLMKNIYDKYREYFK